ncbi:hypothetical protein BWR59_17100 [Pseudomonas sp. Bc-h]|uniref:hypothetical protein n=1 Tax=Pseudomonas sp. Bc-h TaxID=1943632 RepID=UPI0009DAE205|nr:hypothetical protein [Pseudomonas sp. Bc-h]OQR30277.1 hypothetical protein BWR59_17100 [Pseudomonas sp. Bc-h]
MSISFDGAMALAYAFQVPGINTATPAPRREFDRSKVFMVMKQNFDEFTRLTVVMDGGHRFEIDSNKVPFNIHLAADWLVGEA